MNADGTNIRRLPVGSGQIVNLYPQFSPDGSKIMFYKNVTSDIVNTMIINTDGSNLKQLSLGLRSNIFAVFSPDVSHVGFSGFSNNAHEIYTVTTNGTYQIQRTSLGGKNPDWATGSVPAPPTNAASSAKPARSSSITSS